MLKNKVCPIYITDEFIEEREKSSRNRGEAAMAKSELEMTTILETEIQRMRKDQVKGKDYLLHTVERRIGKTTVILVLAARLGIPIIADGEIERFLKGDAMYLGLEEKIKVISTYDIERGKIGGLHIREVLLDEMTDARKVRQTLNNKFLGYINIIGIQ